MKYRIEDYVTKGFLENIISSINFWNKWDQSKKPVDLLDMILSDCEVFSKSAGYSCGRGGSHVWINHKNRRIMMIFC